MIKLSEHTLAGFVAEAQRCGIAVADIPYLLKAAGWMQAARDNPAGFEAGMVETLQKSAAPTAPRMLRAMRHMRGAGHAAGPAASQAVSGLAAAGRPAAATAAAHGFRGIVPVIADAGKRTLEGLRYLAFGPKPGAAIAAGGGGGGLKTLGMLGAGGAAAYGGAKGLEALEGATADQKLLDDIVNYRNQYADFVTKQTMLGSLPGLTSQPRLGGWSQYQ